MRVNYGNFTKFTYFTNVIIIIQCGKFRTQRLLLLKQKSIEEF